MDSAAKILIVDDSRIFRSVIETVFRDEPEFCVVGSVYSGVKALELIRSRSVDLVTLDVEMPEMNGLQTLEKIQVINGTRPIDQQIGVIMVSAFTQRGAEITVRALQAGAFDFVTKPSGGSADENLERLREELLPRVRYFLNRRRQRATGAAILPPGGQSATSPTSAVYPPKHQHTAEADSQSSVSVTAPMPRPVRAVLIAASTGGPKALSTLLPDLVHRVAAPIVIIQHMPAQFTRSLAEHLGRIVDVPTFEVDDGMLLQPRAVYVARGGYHLLLQGDNQEHLRAVLNEDAAESGCRPSASVLFRSAAAALGRNTVAIVLTGMGDDGTAGLVSLHQRGAYVIAQDESTSVVWGMPGAAVAAGLVHTVLPLEAIPLAVEKIALSRGN